MPQLRERLSNPLVLAAIMVWIGVGADLWVGTPRPRGPLDSGAVYVLSIVLHAAFLPLVVLVECKSGPLWRRLAPDVATLALVLGLCALRPFGAVPVLLVVVMAGFAQHLSVRAGIALLVAVNAVVLAIQVAAWSDLRPLLQALMMTSFQLFAMGVAWAMRSAEDARDRLAHANAELRATRSLLAESARDQERLRLSRELHDVAGHKLTALKLNLAAAVRKDGGDSAPDLALAARLADELLSDIRGVVAQMRDHDGMNLRAAIEQLAAPLPRPKVHVAVEPDATVETVEQAEAVVRSVQEALTNAARHAEAENVWVVLRRAGGRLEIEVRDDGRGTGPLRLGNGLRGMRERLQALGGDLTVARGPTGGVALHGWLRLA
jgi:signal transduction histidine kinase